MTLEGGTAPPSVSARPPPPGPAFPVSESRLQPAGVWGEKEGGPLPRARPRPVPLPSGSLSGIRTPPPGGHLPSRPLRAQVPQRQEAGATSSHLAGEREPDSRPLAVASPGQTPLTPPLHGIPGEPKPKRFRWEWRVARVVDHESPRGACEPFLREHSTAFLK